MMTRVAAMLLTVLGACGSPSRPTTPVSTLPMASASRRPASHEVTTEAHWVPRVARSPFSSAVLSGRNDVYGPLRNNFGTSATAYLGEGRVGMIVSGGRAVWANGKLGAIADASLGLASVLPIAKSLGGGFVLTGTSGVYFAPTFDGAVRKLSGARQMFGGKVGPHSVLCGEQVVSTITGRPTRSNVSDLYAHTGRGFAVAVTSSGEAWFTADGLTWKKLAILPVGEATEDGDALVLLGDAREAARIGADGKLAKVTLTDEERFALRMRQFAPRPTPEDAFEGGLIEAGWQPTGRNPGEWVGVRGRDILVVRSPSREPRKIGMTREDGCAVLAFERPLVVCTAVGARMHVFDLDLATGATQLEKAFDAKGGVFRLLGGVPGAYPPTLLASATCKGVPDAGWCVRDSHGEWLDFTTTPARAALLAFPGSSPRRSEPGPKFHWCKTRRPPIRITLINPHYLNYCAAPNPLLALFADEDATDIDGSEMIGCAISNTPT